MTTKEAHFEGPNPSNSIRIMDPEFGKPANLLAKDIKQLFYDVQKYNDDFSAGSMLSRSVFGLFLLPFEDEDQAPQSPTEVLKNEPENQLLKASALKINNENTLALMGLSLEPVAGKTMTIFFDVHSAGAGEMRLNLANSEQFICFLDQLDAEFVKHSGLTNELAMLSQILAQQISDHYDLANPNEHQLELLGHLPKIASALKGLTSGWAIELLETYSQYAQKRCLREYIVVERTGLLREPGKNFGPADWQKDSSTKHLETRWAQALFVVNFLLKNPHSRELFDVVTPHLQKCVNIAINDIEGLSYFDEERRSELKQVLQKAKENLDQFEFSDSQNELGEVFYS